MATDSIESLDEGSFHACEDEDVPISRHLDSTSLQEFGGSSQEINDSEEMELTGVPDFRPACADQQKASFVQEDALSLSLLMEEKETLHLKGFRNENQPEEVQLGKECTSIQEATGINPVSQTNIELGVPSSRSVFDKGEENVSRDTSATFMISAIKPTLSFFASPEASYVSESSQLAAPPSIKPNKITIPMDTRDEAALEDPTKCLEKDSSSICSPVKQPLPQTVAKLPRLDLRRIKGVKTTKSKARKTYVVGKSLKKGTTAYMTQQTEVNASTIAQQSKANVFSITQQPGASTSSVRQQPVASTSSVRQQPGVSTSSVAQQPDISASSVRKQPGVSASFVTQQPEVSASSIAQQPGVSTSSVRQQPEVSASSIAQQPEISVSSIAQQPEVNTSSVAQQPEVNASFVTQQSEVSASFVTQQPEISASSIAQQPEISASSVRKQPGVSASFVTQQTEVNASTIAQQPEVNTSSVAQQPEVSASSIAQQPEISASSIAQQPEVNTSSVAQQPEVNASFVTQQSEVSASFVTQQPEISASSIAQQPEISASSVRKQPGVSASSIAQQPGVSASFVTQQPEVSASSIAQQPEISASSIAQQPEVSASSVTQQPEVSAFSVTQQPEVSASSVAQQPEVSASSIRQPPEVSASSVRQQPEINVPSISQQPKVSASSVTQQPVTYIMQPSETSPATTEWSSLTQSSMKCKIDHSHIVETPDNVKSDCHSLYNTPSECDATDTQDLSATSNSPATPSIMSKADVDTQKKGVMVNFKTAPQVYNVDIEDIAHLDASDTLYRYSFSIHFVYIRHYAGIYCTDCSPVEI